MDVEWGYSGDKGPENWASLCDWFARGAEFPLQSPIHLTKGEETKIEGDTLSFHYQKQRFTDKEFKNTIHLVPFDQLSYVEFKKERYYLTDIHFHLPSEHIINGKQEDIEFHFVHMNSKKENLVVGVMYQLMVQESGCVLSGAKKPFPLYWLIDNSAYQRANPMVCNGSCRKTEPRVSSPLRWSVCSTEQPTNPALEWKRNLLFRGV